MYKFILYLQLIFITLKLTDNIDWSWWIILMPLYIGVPVSFVLFLAILIFCAWDGGDFKK